MTGDVQKPSPRALPFHMSQHDLLTVDRHHPYRQIDGEHIDEVAGVAGVEGAAQMSATLPGPIGSGRYSTAVKADRLVTFGGSVE
jgi:hypothetical protein